MKTGIYNGQIVKVYESGNEFIVEFENGVSITLSSDKSIQYT